MPQTFSECLYEKLLSKQQCDEIDDFREGGGGRQRIKGLETHNTTTLFPSASSEVLLLAPPPCTLSERWKKDMVR